MGFFDDLDNYFTGPQRRLLDMQNEEKRNQLDDEERARDARQNLLSGQFDAQPAGVPDKNGVTWDTARPEDVDAKRNLLSQINPQAAIAPDMNRFFPPAVDPDKRFKTAGDTLFDLNAPGGPQAVGTGARPADNELVNVIDSQNPNGKPYALTKARAAALIEAAPPGRYAIGGAVSDTPKAPATQMTPQQIKSWGLPDGTVAAMVNGKPEVISSGQMSDPPKRLPNQSDEEYLADLQAWDPGSAAMAKQIASYDQPMPSTRSGKVSPIAKAAAELNPDANTGDFKAKNAVKLDFSTGKAADLKQYLGRTISNLGTYYDAVSALNNHGGLATVLNAPGNLVEGAAGSGAVSSAKEAADTFATEARNVFAKSGGGNLEEFKTWQGHVSPNASPDQLEKNKNTFLKNFDGQLDALASKWNNVMPNKKTKADILAEASPEAIDTIQRIAPDYYKKLTGQNAPSAAPTATVPARQLRRPAPPAAAQSPSKVVIQNGWRYDAATHRPLGPVQQ